MTTRRYDVHGVGVRITSNDERVVEAVHERLRRFAPDPRADDVSFELLVGGELPAMPAGPARTIYEPVEGVATYYPADDALYVRLSDAALSARVADGATRAASPSADGRGLWVLSRPFVTLPLIESLKRRGLYSLHAAAAAIDGRGLLVAGPAGAGKTTTALALARAGFDLLGDDMVLLAWDGALVAHALPDPLDVTESTLAMFPELFGHTITRAGWPKRQVDLGAAGKVAMRCVPKVVLVAEVSDAGRSGLEPLDAGRALIELGPNVLLTEPQSSQRHLDALAELARTARCFRVVLGRDLDVLAERLRELVLGD